VGHYLPLDRVQAHLVLPHQVSEDYPAMEATQQQVMG
jgi:hypothetical protein